MSTAELSGRGLARVTASGAGIDTSEGLEAGAGHASCEVGYGRRPGFGGCSPLVLSRRFWRTLHRVNAVPPRKERGQERPALGLLVREHALEMPSGAVVRRVARKVDVVAHTDSSSIRASVIRRRQPVYRTVSSRRALRSARRRRSRLCPSRSSRESCGPPSDSRYVLLCPYMDMQGAKRRAQARRSPAAPLPVDVRPDPEVRRRLSGPALRTFFNIAAAWQLTVQEQRALLGLAGGLDVPQVQGRRSRRADLRHADPAVAGRSASTRACRCSIPSRRFADTWPRMPNSHPIFGGRPALDAHDRRRHRRPVPGAPPARQPAGRMELSPGRRRWSAGPARRA